MNTRTLPAIAPVWAALIWMTAFSGCLAERGRAGSVSQTELALGTLCRIELWAPSGAQRPLFDRLFARLNEIDAMMSAQAAESEISRVNGAAGVSPVSVSPELFAVLERALYFAAVSDGAFDPTIGPLVRLWGIGGNAPRVPAPEEIAAARELVNWQDLELAFSGADGDARTAFLRRSGMALDVGAIAKGFAADELTAILRESGVSGAVLDLGGNIYVYGTRPSRDKGRKWRVGIQNPLDERGVYAGYIELDEGTVVTSGVYERFFEAAGRRWHHILNTATGFPVDNGLLSVTVSARSSMDADALSTALFALGYEKGRALAEKEGVFAVFIFGDKTVRTAGAANFTLTGGEFRLLELFNN
jgi:thiamine biosynthesis lipoprotein